MRWHLCEDIGERPLIARKRRKKERKWDGLHLDGSMKKPKQDGRKEYFSTLAVAAHSFDPMSFCQPIFRRQTGTVVGHYWTQFFYDFVRGLTSSYFCNSFINRILKMTERCLTFSIFGILLLLILLTREVKREKVGILTFSLGSTCCCWY